jgi:cell division protein FtsW (lipid II flippase)
MDSRLRAYLRHTSWPIILAMAALLAVGVLSIRAAEAGATSVRLYRQLAYCAVALAAFFAATAVPYPRFGELAYPLFGLVLGLLVLVLLLPPVKNVHRWIALGPIQVQVSELAKLSYILMLAWYLRYRDNYRRLAGLALPLALTFVPMALVLTEPDLGTALLFLPTLYFMLFMAGAKLRHLLGIVAAGTLLVVLPLPMERQAAGQLEAIAYGWGSHKVIRAGGREYVLLAAPLSKMEPHQANRIVGWLRQDDPDVSFQLARSKMLIGAGGLAGRGGWDDRPGFFAALPERHTDFIFSVIAGQWGLAGCLAVLGVYAAIFVVGLEIAVLTHDAFGRLLAIGVLALMTSQMIVNVSMTMGLLPVTGMTLPLVSYGGSSLVVNGAALGLLVNVGNHRPILLARRPFEFTEKEQPAPEAGATRTRGR